MSTYPLVKKIKRNILLLAMNYKTFLSVFVSIFVVFFLGIYFYDKASVKTVSYSGISSEAEHFATGSRAIFAQTIVIVPDEVKQSEKIIFNQRKITGGGKNPGWVISLLETQPNIFTGRVIVDDGVYQHPVTLVEGPPNILIGEMKSVTGSKEVLNLKKEDLECKDEEGNTFEYSLSGFYGKTQISGCGGSVISQSK